MSSFWWGNTYLLLSMLCASGSQIVFKALFNEIGPFTIDSFYFEQLAAVRTVFRIAAALALLVAGFIFWLMCLSRLDLSYAYSIACSSALFVMILSVMFLGETISVRMWCGGILIVAGIVLLVPSHS